MLPLLKIDPWHVTKAHFIQCLLGGRQTSHSKHYTYIMDMSNNEVTVYLISSIFLIFAFS